MSEPENMSLERAMEILDPTHREHYESIDPVNEACLMGMNALGYRIPESPYPHKGVYNVLTCPTCGSGEYLCNEDGNTNHFCGQCGQAIDWEEKDG